MGSKYQAIFRLAAAQTLKNYKSLIGLNLILIICLVIFSYLWKVASAKTGMISWSPEELLWYIAFNEWVLISIPDIETAIEQDLHTGKLAYLLPRPISYMGSMFFEAFGILTIHLFVLGIVGFSFTWIMTGIFPFTLPQFTFSIILGFVSGIIGTLFRMAIGISSFWLKEVDPFTWIWEKLLFTFGGLLLPLSVYPKWLEKIALFTPFPAILGGRSEYAIDPTFAKLSVLILSLSFWGLFALLILIVLYRRGLKILTIEGG